MIELAATDLAHARQVALGMEAREQDGGLRPDDVGVAEVEGQQGKAEQRKEAPGQETPAGGSAE